MGHVYATRGGSVEGRATLENPGDDFTKALFAWANGLEGTSAPRSVTAESAFRGTTAVYACVRAIAEAFQTMPLILYRDGEVRERIPPTRGMARLLHQQANPTMTAGQFWETMVGIANLWGNAYALVERNAAGEPIELWPLWAGSVKPLLIRGDRVVDPRDPNQLRGGGLRRAYQVRLPSGEKRGLLDHEVLHVPALAMDGLEGVSPITVARRTIAATQSRDQFKEKFFDNNAIPGGIISVTDRRLTDQDVARYRSEWERMHRGLDNVQKVAVMDAGVSWVSVGMPLADAQFVESEMNDALAIARVFRVQPHKLGILDRATWANIEHQGIEWLTDGVGPWAARVEGAVNRDLGAPPRTLRDSGLIAEFLAESLLRMDTKSRWEAYRIGWGMGALTRRDIRKRENLPPLPGDDLAMVQGATAVIGEDGVPILPKQAPAADPQDDTEPAA